MTDPRFQRVLSTVLLVVLGMAVGSARFALAQEPAKPESAHTVSSGSNQFAFDLLSKLASSRKDTNFFFSPVSISMALGMVYAGSEGETKAQMAKTLHFAGSQQEVAAGFHGMMVAMNQPADAAYQLSVANALWAQQSIQLEPQFASLMQTYYAGQVRTVNFAQAQQSVDTINRWVAEKTANKIRALLQPGDVDPLTRLVLTNAVYFKGDWGMPFEEAMTKPDTFTTAAGTKQQVPMMHQSELTSYGETPSFQAISLPYRGGELSMVILLPREASREPWKGLTWEKVQKLRSAMSSHQVDVFLPRFKVQARLSLVKTLAEMGMPDAFSRRANFAGMNSKERWYISAVVHEAVVDVNEKGTEAAAATGVIVKPAVMMAEPPAVFRADHPFLYLIVHQPTNAILFMGGLAEPQ